jgi:hypothetical protein
VIHIDDSDNENPCGPSTSSSAYPIHSEPDSLGSAVSALQHTMKLCFDALLQFLHAELDINKAV